MNLTLLNQKMNELKEAYFESSGFAYEIRFSISDNGSGKVEIMNDPKNPFVALSFDEIEDIIPRFNREIMRWKGNL